MFAEPTPTAAHDPLTLLLTSLAPIAVAVAALVNHLKGKRRDSRGGSVLERIERTINQNHTETLAAVKDLDARVDAVEAMATKSKHVLVGTGPLEDNGIKSRVEDLERWKQEEIETELERLRQHRGMGPKDVGTFTPRTT